MNPNEISLEEEVINWILDQCYMHDVQDDKGTILEHVEGHSKKCNKFNIENGRSLCHSEMELSS